MNKPLVSITEYSYLAQKFGSLNARKGVLQNTLKSKQFRGNVQLLAELQRVENDIDIIAGLMTDLDLEILTHYQDETGKTFKALLSNSN